MRLDSDLSDVSLAFDAALHLILPKEHANWGSCRAHYVDWRYVGFLVDAIDSHDDRSDICPAQRYGLVVDGR